MRVWLNGTNLSAQIQSEMILMGYQKLDQSILVNKHLFKQKVVGVELNYEIDTQLQFLIF